MKAHILQHVAFEGAAGVRSWLDARGAEVTHTRFFEDAALPSPGELDLVVVMGGPMSVNDEAAHPWLREEKAFLRSAIAGCVPTLGICLGAQMIASAMGARVYKNRTKEIGWFPVRAEAAPEGCFAFPESLAVFHWHGETFDLPSGALLLATSAACRNQAYQVGRRAVGLQFHLEVTPESVDALIANCRDELVQAEFIQTEARMRAVGAAAYAKANAVMAGVLDYLTAAGSE